MPRTSSEIADFAIDPHYLYDLNDAASKVGLSSWHLREKAVSERRVAFIRHSTRGKILFRGKDLLAYLDSLRTPALGEKSRAAAQAAVATK